MFGYFRGRSVLLILLLLFTTLPVARGQELFRDPTSSFVFDTSLGNQAPAVTVWYYRPDHIVRDTRVVFLMHGSSRTGKEARDLGLSFAKTHDFILLAPEFSRQHYPDDSYAFANMLAASGKIRPKSSWASTTIERLFDVVRKSLNLATETYDIVGHSAGGQLVHRLVLFAPDSRFRRAVASSPGRYAFPTASQDFPYGLKGTSLNSSVVVRAFSRDFILVLGDRDTVDRDREIEAERQGANRFARGLRFFATATEEANRLKVPLAWRLRILNGADHSPGPAVQAVFEELFR